MSTVKILSLAAAMLLILVSGLQAEVDFSIVDTLKVEDPTFRFTLQVDETHYVTMTWRSVALFQVDQTGIVELDREISVKPFFNSFYGMQLVDSRLYVLSSSAGVVVYEVSTSSLTFMDEIPLHQLAGRSYSNRYLKLFGNRMVVWSLYDLDPCLDHRLGQYSVYDVSDLSAPLLLGSFDVPGNYLLLIDIHQTDSGYYNVFSTGRVCFSQELGQFNWANIVSGFPGGKVETSLYRDNALFMFSRGPSGTSLLKFSHQDGGTLGFEWSSLTPLFLTYRCWQEADRVLVVGHADPFTVLSYLSFDPSASPWTLQFHKLLHMVDIFRMGENYLGFGVNDVLILDHDLNQTQVLNHVATYYPSDLVMNRYVVMEAINYLTFGIYDLQNRAWLNCRFTGNIVKTNRSVNDNQVFFREISLNEYQLLTLDDQGSYTLDTFTIPPGMDFYDLKDIWGDRVLMVHSNTQGSILKVCQIVNNSLTVIASGTVDSQFCTDLFYDANHIATNGLRPDGSFDYVLHRINQDGSIQEILRVPSMTLGYFHVGQGILFEPLQGKPVIDISDPDNPFQISTVSAPLSGNYRTISYDGQSRYLCTEGNHKFIMNEDFDYLARFQDESAFYIAPNTIMLGDLNLLTLVQHPDIVENSDPHVPEPEEQISTLYPNPFRSELHVAIKAREAGLVSARIYNLRGQLVKDLWQGRSSPGSLELSWDGTDNNGKPAASGIYLVRINAGGKQETSKAVLIRN